MWRIVYHQLHPQHVHWDSVVVRDGVLSSLERGQTTPHLALRPGVGAKMGRGKGKGHDCPRVWWSITHHRKRLHLVKGGHRSRPTTSARTTTYSGGFRSWERHLDNRSVSSLGCTVVVPLRCGWLRAIKYGVDISISTERRLINRWTTCRSPVQSYPADYDL